MVYLIGSLRNPEIPRIATRLRDNGFDVFDDWFAAGPEADDKWRDYERARGRTQRDALKGYAAQHVFNFDKAHLLRASAVVLAAPAGKSGHMEFGWSLGRGCPGYYLLNGDPDRYDVMLNFATKVVTSVDELVGVLNENHHP